MQAPITETPLTEVFHQPGDSDLVLLVFADAGASSWSGADAAAALGIETFLIRQKSAHDYAGTDMSLWLDAVDARIRGGRRLVLVGSGVGAVAALRASGLTGASYVLALSPVAAAPISLPQFCDCFVLADPRTAPPAWPDAVPVPIEDLPADAGILLSAPARLRRLLTFVRARVSRRQRASTIRAWALRERRAGAAYLGALADRLSAHGHLCWLADVVARADLAGQSDPRLTIARAALMHAAGDGAGAIALAHTVTGDAAPRAAGLLAAWLAEVGEIAQARLAYAAADACPESLRRVLASRAVALPSPPPLDPARVHASVAGGAPEGALRDALRSHPRDSGLLLSLARSHGAAGALPQAAAALRAALAADTAGELAGGLLGLVAPAAAQSAETDTAEPAAPRRKPARARVA